MSHKCQGYLDEDGGRRPGHLVLYPIEVGSQPFPQQFLEKSHLQVSPHGEVSSVQDFFPDTAALIEGTKSSHLPGKLTT